MDSLKSSNIAEYIATWVRNVNPIALEIQMNISSIWRTGRSTNLSGIRDSHGRYIRWSLVS